MFGCRLGEAPIPFIGFNSFSAIAANPSISDQIRVTFLTGFRSTPVQVSPTQSNLVQPNPTTPPPPGKEIGKETVKFLAIFDHVSLCALSSPFSLLTPVKSCPEQFFSP
jgi:hypothetical protein